MSRPSSRPDKEAGRRRQAAGLLTRGVIAGSSILFACALATSPAWANGRYPSAQQLLVDPGDPNRLWLRATYGLLTSGDAGKSWGWICEQAVGYSFGEDPVVAVAADGTALAGATEGLFSTSNHGCSWSGVPPLDTHIIDDLTTEADASHVYALANLVKSDGTYELTVWRSDDSGHSFGAVGAPLAADLLGRTIDVAPSDPTRLYVTAVPAHAKPATRGDAGPDAGVGYLLVSIDRGATWQTYSIPGTSVDDQPFIAAVHPSKPDVLYVRTRSPQTDTGFVESRLLYSDSAGASLREVFRGSADMLGFALADGGSRVLVGLGDSRDALNLRPVDPSALGIYRAEAPDFVFERALRGQVGCLTMTAAGLYVCGSNATLHYELGLSRDVGITASRVFTFGAQIGLLSCDESSSVSNACASLWPIVCEQVGSCAIERDSGAPGAKPPSVGGSGCCGSASSTAKTDGTNTRTARLDVQAPPWLVALAATAAIARRRRRGS